MRDRQSTKTILLLASNPSDTVRLRLGREAAEIDTGLQRGAHRDQFHLHQRWDIQPDDIRQSLFRYKPQIVHFCGHGTGVNGLAVEDENGQMRLLPTAALADLFSFFASELECVLLNACYSEVQAEAISQHVDYVIGMSQAVGDRAAIKFAVGFYEALGDGRSYEEAYRIGCNAVDMFQLPQNIVLKTRKKIGDRTPPKPRSQTPPKPQSRMPQALFSSPSQKSPSTPIRQGYSSSQRASTKSATKSSSQRVKSTAFFLTVKKIWFFLLPMIAIWGFVGILQQDWIDAPNSQGLISLICLGAFGGLISGVLMSVAQQTVFPKREWLPALFLRSLLGMVSGSLLWAMFGSLIPIQTSGLTFGLLFGVIATMACVWKLNQKRSRA